MCDYIDAAARARAGEPKAHHAKLKSLTNLVEVDTRNDIGNHPCIVDARTSAKSLRAALEAERGL